MVNICTYTAGTGAQLCQDAHAMPKHSSVAAGAGQYVHDNHLAVTLHLAYLLHLMVSLSSLSLLTESLP